MGRRLIRAGEALRRLVGKPGRRSGVDKRKKKETLHYGSGEYTSTFIGGSPKKKITIAGPELRSGTERRRSK